MIKKFLNEFKEFAVRGNVIDMAIGIVIGASFSKIVNSLVEDIIMPPIGLILKRVDFSNIFVSLDGNSYKNIAEARAAGAATINYGIFINSLISFLIIGVVVFFIVKQANKLKRKEDTSSLAPTQKSCPFCLMSISIQATRCPFCTSQLGVPEK